MGLRFKILLLDETRSQIDHTVWLNLSTSAVYLLLRCWPKLKPQFSANDEQSQWNNKGKKEFKKSDERQKNVKVTKNHIMSELRLVYKLCTKVKPFCLCYILPITLLWNCREIHSNWRWLSIFWVNEAMNHFYKG